MARVTLQTVEITQRVGVNTFRTKAPLWVRVIAAVTAVIYLVTGIWAVVAPRNWFETFPGFGEPLVAAEPPFNAHLATDAGAGFLAVAVTLLVAVALGDRLVMLVAAAALFAHAAPHFAFHIMNPADYVEASTNVTSLTGLVVAAIIPVVLLITIRKTEGA